MWTPTHLRLVPNLQGIDALGPIGPKNDPAK